MAPGGLQTPQKKSIESGSDDLERKMRKNCHPKRKHPALSIQQDCVGNQQSPESEVRHERLRGHEYLEKL